MFLRLFSLVPCAKIVQKEALGIFDILHNSSFCKSFSRQQKCWPWNQGCGQCSPTSLSEIRKSVTVCFQDLTVAFLVHLVTLLNLDLPALFLTPSIPSLFTHHRRRETAVRKLLCLPRPPGKKSQSLLDVSLNSRNRWVLQTQQDSINNTHIFQPFWHLQSSSLQRV